MMCGVNSTRRMVWALVLGVIVALGLASRRFAAELPPLIAKYAGDTSYACAMFALVALIGPGWSIAKVAMISLVACVIVEISQLYHVPWIDSIRATRIGGWILGFGFLWSDLICYLVGVAMMATLTRLASGGSIATRHPKLKET